MHFKKNKSARQIIDDKLKDHLLFWPVLVFIFILWLAYRYFTRFPVWFDETLGKAIFFGLPVWFYIVSAKFNRPLSIFQPGKLWRGLFLGLAFGGIFGFVIVIMRLMQHGVVIRPAAIFMADNFDYELLMGLFTSFWETLFFFGFVANVILIKYKRISLIGRALSVSFIFVAFHLANTFIRFAGTQAIIGQILILGLLALGQFLIFYRRRNGYMLVLSQLIWGMALLVYGW